MVVGYASLKSEVLSWLLNVEMMCWDLTLSGSLILSTGMAIAKPCPAFTVLLVKKIIQSLSLSSREACTSSDDFFLFLNFHEL